MFRDCLSQPISQKISQVTHLQEDRNLTTCDFRRFPPNFSIPPIFFFAHILIFVNSVLGTDRSCHPLNGWQYKLMRVLTIVVYMFPPFVTYEIDKVQLTNARLQQTINDCKCFRKDSLYALIYPMIIAQFLFPLPKNRLQLLNNVEMGIILTINYENF